MLVKANNFKAVTVFFILLISGGVVCHASPIDSLLHELSVQTEQDTNRARTLIQLAKSYSRIDLDSSLIFALEAGKIAELTDSDSYRSKSLYWQTLYYFFTGALETADSVIQIREDIAREMNDSGAWANSLYLHGIMLTKIGRQKEAIEKMLLSVEILTATNDSSDLGAALVNLGGVLYNNQEFDRAIQYYISAKGIYDNLGDSVSSALVNHNIGSIYVDQGKVEEGLKFLLEAMEIQEANESEKAELINTYHNLAAAYLQLKKPQKTEEYYRKSLALSYELEMAEGIQSGYQGLAEFHFKMGDKDSALYYVDRSIQEAEKTGVLPLIIGAYKLKSSIEEDLGLFELALDDLNTYVRLSDSLESIEESDLASELAVKYEVEKKEEQFQLMEAAQKERELRNFWMLVLSAIIFLLLIVIVFFIIRAWRKSLAYGKYQKRQRDLVNEKRKELEQINKQLIELNQEKDNLMGIVAHDLRGPLNKAASIGNLLPSLGDLNASQKDMLDLMDRVIQSGKKLIEELVLISKVESMDTLGDLQVTDLFTLIEPIIDETAAQTQSKNIKIHLESETQAKVDVNQEHFSRIIDNLLSNAIKFSSPGTEVKVQLIQEDEKVKVSVIDQGPGIKEEERGLLFKKFSKTSNQPTAGEASSGLGLYIVKQLAERMGGGVAVSSRIGEGSVFTVWFPAA